MAAIDPLNTLAGRLATFEISQRLPKRRASATKKKAQAASSPAGWPHSSPSPEQLAHAGFYYKPTPTHQDSVTCFFCDRSLDSWDTDDNPAKEHLAHVPTCAWAINVCIEQRQMDAESREQDPLSKEMLEVRRSTFKDMWPHEKKKGWKCKVKKMVEAGWTYNPLPEADDCVTCFYCSVALDGWEPKDDPLEEHRRRAPDCDFFNLIEKAKQEKPPSKGGRGRTSRNSKVSRASTVSVGSVAQAEPFTISDECLLGLADDSSIVTITSTTNKSTKATRTTKKGGRTKKSSKVKDAEQIVNTNEQSMDECQNEPEPEPMKRSTRQRIVRDSLQLTEMAPSATILEGDEGAPSLQDVNVIENPQQPNKKAVPQRKTFKTSMIGTTGAGSTGESNVEEPKRGRKRTSEGVEKAYQDDSVVLLREAATVSKAASSKNNRPVEKTSGRAPMEVAYPSLPLAISTDDFLPDVELALNANQRDRAEVKEPAKPKRASKAKKAKTSAVLQMSIHEDEPVIDEVARVNESTTSASQKDQPSDSLARQRPTQPTKAAVQEPSPSPSAQSSDAENQPPSSRPSLRSQLQSPPILPNTTRVPLAPTTPSKSPHKNKIVPGNLATAKPWTEVDIEAIFLPSPATAKLTLPSGVSDKDKENLAAVLKALSSPERRMNVEDWVAFNAQGAEQRLKGECERLVGIFEREGMRALQCVEGIEVD